MINWFKKPSITFECLIPGIERIMPMIPARELKHPWVGRAQKELAELRKSPNWGTETMLHTAKCPGIFSLQRHGWVMRTWQDITIETFGDSEALRWSTPIDQKQISPQCGEYVSLHTSREFAQYMENWREGTLRTVLKIQSPWRCHVPRGYYLLEMGVPFLDENRFTTIQGFHSAETGYAQMTPQLLWQVPKGKTLIKAGTPIAQYMLVPKDKFEMNIKAIGTVTDQEFFQLATHTKFVKSYGETRKLFGEINELT